MNKLSITIRTNIHRFYNRVYAWLFKLNFQLDCEIEDSKGFVTQVWVHKIFSGWKVTSYFFSQPRHINCRCSTIYEN